MKETLVKFVVFSSVLFSCLVSQAQTTSSTARAASVLSSRFETIVYTDARFLLNFEADSTREESLNALRLPYIQFSAGLRTLSATAETEITSHYTSVLVGSKDFRSPEGVGVVTSHQCYVAVNDGPQVSVDRVFTPATSTSIDGTRAWTWTMPPYEGYSATTTFYAAQVGSSYLVMANTREDFLAIAAALASAPNRKLASVNILDWNNMNNHEYWAYRSIRRTGVLDPEAAALNHVNPELQAMSFYADISRRTSKLRVWSLDVSQKGIPKVLPDSEYGQFTVESDGVWAAPLSLTQDRRGLEAVTKLFFCLGHGIAF
jgi:hypothetical protein